MHLLTTKRFEKDLKRGKNLGNLFLVLVSMLSIMAR